MLKCQAHARLVTKKMFKSSIDYLHFHLCTCILPVSHIGVGSKFEVYSGHIVPQNAAMGRPGIWNILLKHLALAVHQVYLQTWFPRRLLLTTQTSL